MRNPKYLSLIGLAAMLSQDHFNNSVFSSRSKVQGREFKPCRVSKTIIPKGCNKYNIKGIEVIAISKKSAIKKVNRILKERK